MKIQAVALFALVVAGCGNSGADLCKDVSGQCKVLKTGVTEADVQTAAVTVGEGGTIVLDKGVYMFSNGINFQTKNITMRGAGMDQTILDFSAQAAGSQGIYASRDGFTLSDLTVRNTGGDGVKTEGISGVTFRKVHVVWDSPDLTKHSAYGLYPVACNNVLIEDSIVEGAADAGFYVGQSTNIIVRNNTADKNVAGIEIENCHSAEVYGNTATHNSGGILVFSLPGLTVPDCRDVSVHDNMIINNDQANFAAEGNIVHMVPAGTGMVVMAARNVEVFKNTFTDNETSQASIISYLLAKPKFDPASNTKYDAYPDTIWFHNNTFNGGGKHPDSQSLLGLALGLSPFPNHVVSNLIYDGVVDATHQGSGAHPNNTMDICVSDSAGITFANTHTDLAALRNNMAPFDGLSTDMTAYSCSLTAVPPVKLN